MVPNRRQFSRRPTQSLVIVTVDETNAGIPRNLARGGVALDLVQPVTEHQIVTLGFVRPGGGNRIEAAAEAVWIDDSSGPNAGFRFLNMPQKSYESIEDWLARGGNGHEASIAPHTAAGSNTTSLRPASAGDSAAYAVDWTSVLSQPIFKQQLGSNRFETSPTFTQAVSGNYGGVAHEKTTASTAKIPFSLLTDSLDARTAVLDTATVMSEGVDADKTQPSNRIRLLAEVLRNPYVRRKLIVSGVLAAVLIAGAVVCALWVRFHRELLSPGAWSASIRNLIAGTAAKPDPNPEPDSSVVTVKKHPSRRNRRPDHGSASTSSAAKRKNLKVDGAVARDKPITTASNLPPVNDKAELPAITIVSSRYSPQSLSATSLGYSRILVAPVDATVDPVHPLPGALVEISGSLPEGQPRLTYPASARQKKLEGSVTVRAAIRQDGSVRSVRLVSGDPLLASAVLGAVEQWRYKPWSAGPAEAEALIMVKFTVSTK